MRCLPAAALALFAPSRADTRGARAQSYRGDRCRTSSGQPGQGHGRRLRQRHPGARLQVDPDGSVSLDPEITLAQGQPRPRNHTVRLLGRQARHAHHVEYLPDEFRRSRRAAGRHLFARHSVGRGHPAARGNVGQDLRSHRVDRDLRRVRPHYVEGRIGLGITGLLTLVAAHFERHAAPRRLPDDARQDFSP